MVFNTAYHQFRKSMKSHANVTLRWRQLGACAIVGLLTACASGENPEDLGKVGYVKGFLGAVSSDEPRSALVGRDILSAGGTAADAVAAMYFAASVTMPASASLGGGGVCVYHDSRDKKTEVLDFLTRAPKNIPAGIERPVGVPMNARGFFLLQSRYGDLHWGSVVSPAENLARFGERLSRALAAELEPVGPSLIIDKEAARVFAGPSGQPVRAGDTLKQLDLAASLSEIRSKGPGALYSGPFAKRFVDAVNAAGGYITANDLRDALPVWRETVQALDYDYKVAHFAPPAAAGGVVGAQVWSMLSEYGQFDSDDEQLRAHMLAEFSMRAYGERAGWAYANGQARRDVSYLTSEDYVAKAVSQVSPARHQRAQTLAAVPQPTPEAPSALSLVAVDRFGSAAACNVSMNNAFGVGRIAPGTGILLSALPGLNGRGPMSLGPVIMVNPNSNDVYFVGAASRGVTAPTALVNVMARTVMGNEPLDKALAHPRTHHGGAPDRLYHETTVSGDVLNGLRQRGHDLAAVKGLGLVNAVFCPEGLRVTPESCQVGNDPRGYGLSVGAQ